MANIEVSGSLLTASGVLDGEAELELRNRFRELFDCGAALVTVDLSGVEVIASVCIGALLVLWMDLRSAGRSAKLIPSPPVKEVLDLTGLASVLMTEADAG